MTVVIDPALRILPDDHRIFVLHPGSGKRFYSDFVESSSVFLDIPGIAFAEAPSVDTPDLRNLLRMSKRISLWRREGSPEDKKPSRDPKEYTTATILTETPRFVREVIELYAIARAGDLIIIPGRGYNTNVYIGEFSGEFDPTYAVHSRRYLDETIPARRVKWLPITKLKSDFKHRLIRLMQNRQAIIQITHESDRREVYKIAYGDYIWKDSSGSLIRVTKDHIDLNDLNKAVDLTNYFASQYIALKKGELDHFLQLDFHDAIDEYYDKSYFGDVNVAINSPGYFGRAMKDAMMAGYVSIMLSLSAAAVPAQEAVNAQIQNSANAVASICDQKLEADIRETMEMYANLHLWEDDICPRRQASKDAVGLESDVTIKIERPAH